MCAWAAGSEVISIVHLAVTFVQQGWFAMSLVTLLVMLLVVLGGVTCDVCDVTYHVDFNVACDVSGVSGIACDDAGHVACDVCDVADHVACDVACDIVSDVCGVAC
jgi:hypothetical protein